MPTAPTHCVNAPTVPQAPTTRQASQGERSDFLTYRPFIAKPLGQK